MDPPAVVLLDPLDGATFLRMADIPMAATGSDPRGRSIPSISFSFARNRSPGTRLDPSEGVALGLL